MKNIDLREKIVETGIRHWELAEAMGIHPSVLSVKLRRELPESEKAQLREIIDRLAEGKEERA